MKEEGKNCCEGDSKRERGEGREKREGEGERGRGGVCRN